MKTKRRWVVLIREWCNVVGNMSMQIAVSAWLKPRRVKRRRSSKAVNYEFLLLRHNSNWSEKTAKDIKCRKLATTVKKNIMGKPSTVRTTSSIVVLKSSSSHRAVAENK